MNLLPEKQELQSNPLEIVIGDFRRIQYDDAMIKYFINLCIEYLSAQNNNYLQLHMINIMKIPEYMGINDSHYTKVVVYTKVKDTNDVKIMFRLILPTLLNDCFFILNGNYYVPTLYIIDKPIVIKKKSIKLTSLFNSISMYDKLVTFIGINIPAAHFLNVILPDSDLNLLQIKQILSTRLNIPINNTTTTEQDVLNYFHKMFGCEPIRNDILNHMKKLFFDGYTKLLYQNCYNVKEEELTIVKVLEIAAELCSVTTEETFIDLKYKRLIFLEALLQPLFKRIGHYAIMTAKGYKVDEIAMDLMEITKHFQTNLHNKFIYDSVNAYSGMLQHKVNMMNPGSENAPSIIANLHETHFQRICPISISNQNPGETVFVVPTTKVDHFGQFIGV